MKSTLVAIAVPEIPYGIGGNCMDEITFSVIWHDLWIARLQNKSTTRARLLSVEQSGSYS